MAIRQELWCTIRRTKYVWHGWTKFSVLVARCERVPHPASPRRLYGSVSSALIPPSKMCSTLGYSRDSSVGLTTTTRHYRQRAQREGRVTVAIWSARRAEHVAAAKFEEGLRRVRPTGHIIRRISLKALSSGLRDIELEAGLWNVLQAWPVSRMVRASTWRPSHLAVVGWSQKENGELRMNERYAGIVSLRDSR